MAFRRYELATLAVYLLGGSRKSLDTEDVAKKCYQLAPDLFSWVKFADQINLELVRVSLSDAKKEKNGGLVTGVGRDGWRLTSKGFAWCELEGQAMLANLSNSSVSAERTVGSVDSQRRRREKARIVSLSAWSAWQNGSSVSFADAREVLRVDAYTTEKMLDIKATRTKGMFEDDQEVSRFLDEIISVLRRGPNNGD